MCSVPVIGGDTGSIAFRLRVGHQGDRGEAAVLQVWFGGEGAEDIPDILQEPNLGR